MYTEVSLASIFERLSNSLMKVRHITAFIKEETLQTAIIYAIIFFLIASFTIITIILLRRTIAINNTKKKKILVEKYENYLAGTMTYVYENSKIFEKKTYQYTLNKEDQTKPFNRKILLDQIMLMLKHVGGDEASVLRNLYERLGYYRASLLKTKSLLWHTRLEGLQELIAIGSTAFNKSVLNMINDSNPFVRIEVIRALILRGQDWQPTLIKYNYPLSAWEQYQICDALSKIQNIALPDFKPLLTSYNPTVVLFGLHMIKHFHCMDAVKDIAPFLSHPNPTILNAAELALDQFGFDKEARDTGILNEYITSEEINIPKSAFNKADEDAFFNFLETISVQQNQVITAPKKATPPKDFSYLLNDIYAVSDHQRLRPSSSVLQFCSKKKEKEKLYLTDTSQFKTYTRKGKSFTVWQESIADISNKETFCIQKTLDNGRQVHIDVTIWQNFSLKKPKEESLKDTLIDVVCMVIKDAKTGKQLYKRPLYFAVNGRRKAVEMIGKEYFMGSDMPQKTKPMNSKKAITTEILQKASTTI